MQNKGNISTKVKKHIQETLRLTCLWLQQLFCYSTILYFTHRTAYYIETGCCVHGTVHSFILLLTLSNHYYGKSFYTLPNQTLPYRLLYNPAFLHMTVLCCLQSPPPSPANIYTEAVLGRGEERKRKSLLLVCHKISPPFWWIVLHCFTTLYT